MKEKILDKFYEANRIIQAHEVDFTNRLRIDSFFVFLQDIAAAHADKVNLGYNALIKHDLAWVLSWARLEITTYPGFGEEITIRTWPKRRYKLYSLRDFYVYDNNKQIISKAATAWLPINIKTRRIIDSSALPAPIDFLDEPAIDALPQKISAEGDKEFILNKKMRYTDIDLNRHVNNIRYIELIMDCFNKVQYEKSELINIEVQFVSECKYDDIIEMYKAKNTSEDCWYIEGVNKSSSKIIFQANLEWEIK